MKFLHNFIRSVVTAIIDKQQLKRLTDTFHDFDNTLIKMWKRLYFIKNWCNYRINRMLCFLLFYAHFLLAHSIISPYCFLCVTGSGSGVLFHFPLFLFFVYWETSCI